MLFEQNSNIESLYRGETGEGSSMLVGLFCFEGASDDCHEAVVELASSVSPSEDRGVVLDSLLMQCATHSFSF